MYYLINLQKGVMIESLVFVHKHAVCVGFLLGKCISHLKCVASKFYFIQIGHLVLLSLYNHFSVLSFNSI